MAESQAKREEAQKVSAMKQYLDQQAARERHE
jgi:hypothetical protein